MSITKVLNNEKMSDEEKLAAVAETVAGARESYGNTSVKVEVPAVNTPHGVMPFDMLEADSRVNILKGRVAYIKAEAVEDVTNNPAVNINKRIEELIATDAYFTNIDSGVEFSYI
jgi:hypothetical protein